MITQKQNITKARIIHSDGRVYHYDDQQLAYSVYLALPNGQRVAFRSAGDATPVYRHDCVGR